VIDHDHAGIGSDLREPDHGHNLLGPHGLCQRVKNGAVLHRVVGRGVDMNEGQHMGLGQLVEFRRLGWHVSCDLKFLGP